MINPVFIKATTLEDAWFQCIYNIFDNGYKYTIERGSFEGQKRLEFDYCTIQITHPSTRPLTPEIPPGLGIPNPVADGYIEEYLPYLMTSKKHPNEDYTYGERLSGWCYNYDYDLELNLEVNQIEEVIKIYKSGSYGTNQACMEIGVPTDIKLNDPPCLRLIDTRIKNNKLHFIVYFRSWDLWCGMPANLGAIQLLKEYMADEIGVEDGEIIATSKGLHLYDYIWELAQLRTYQNI